MSDVYRFHAGTSPLLVCVPHDGWQIPGDIVQHMDEAGRAIADTDWHVAELFDFVRARGASLLVANYSRYVIDLNRPADDAPMYPGQLSTGLCPTESFAGEQLYLDAAAIDVAARIERYWRPYHQRIEASLAELHAEHGCALLLDAHSIASQVPRLFEGTLPELNIGSFDDRSCAAGIAGRLLQVAAASPYSAVLNGRFKGGFTTRHYGRPEQRIQALQLEIAQRSYMDEATLEFDRDKAAKLRDTLDRMLDAYCEAGSGG